MGSACPGEEMAHLHPPISEGGRGVRGSAPVTKPTVLQRDGGLTGHKPGNWPDMHRAASSIAGCFAVVGQAGPHRARSRLVEVPGLGVLGRLADNERLLVGGVDIVVAARAAVARRRAGH